MDRQERRAGLAVLLPPAQPVRRRPAALAVPARRPDGPGELNHQIKHLFRCSTPPSSCATSPSRTCSPAPTQLHDDLPTQLARGERVPQGVHRRPAPGRPGRLPAGTPREAAARAAPDARSRARLALVSARDRRRSGSSRRSRPLRESTPRPTWPRWTPAGTPRAFDSAIVRMPDGTSRRLLPPRPRQFRDLLRRTIEIHERLYREWPRWPALPQQSLPDVSPRSAWEPQTFRTRDGRRRRPRRRREEGSAMTTTRPRPAGRAGPAGRRRARRPHDRAVGAPRRGRCHPRGAPSSRYLLRLIVAGSSRPRCTAASLLGCAWSYVQPPVRFGIYFFVIGLILSCTSRSPTSRSTCSPRWWSCTSSPRPAPAGTRSIMQQQGARPKMRCRARSSRSPRCSWRRTTPSRRCWSCSWPRVICGWHPTGYAVVAGVLGLRSWSDVRDGAGAAVLGAERLLPRLPEHRGDDRCSCTGSCR